MGSQLKCAMSDPAPTTHQTLVTLVRALRAIAGGARVTAASLARDLDVTADEVDAALAAAEARAAGLSIQSDGTLSLARAFDALDAPGVAAAMAAAARHVFDVHVVPVSGSTNGDLMAHAASLPSGRVLVAELQTAGDEQHRQRCFTGQEPSQRCERLSSLGQHLVELDTRGKASYKFLQGTAWDKTVTNCQGNRWQCWTPSEPAVHSLRRSPSDRSRMIRWLMDMPGRPESPRSFAHSAAAPPEIPNQFPTIQGEFGA